MHKFLHGIRWVLPTALGGSLYSCLPLLKVLHHVRSHEVDNSDLQQAPIDGQSQEGVLPPMRGDDEAAIAVNNDLRQPVFKGPFNEIIQGILPPPKGDEDNQAFQPNQEEIADNTNLQPKNLGRQDEKGILTPRRGDANNKDEDNFDVLPTIKGHFDTVNNCDVLDVLQNWYAYDVQFDIKNDAPQEIDWEVAYAPTNVANGQFAKTNAWLMPSPRPRVKMKGDMKQNDAHAWKHDAWVSPSSPSNSSIHVSLVDAVDHVKLHATALQISHSYFSHLRGKSGSMLQAREMQGDSDGDQSLNLIQKIKFNTLNKDVLDPG